jgi:AmiR/NasT family two-component response regulator
MNAEEILKLAAEKSRKNRKMLLELEESVNRLCRITVTPRAKVLLLSLLRR